ncbi:MAG: hypothetical protein JWQ66_1818 [Mucilaginibacter sp.]|nr:hypothetical protein [Mucilaginibacter sp.]
MKNRIKLLWVICLITIPGFAFAQKPLVLEGRVIDKNTNKPIKYAIVWLMKEDVVCNTEDDGSFAFFSKTFSMSDSLLVRCRGYLPFKIRLGQFVRNRIVILEPNPELVKKTTPVISSVKYQQKTLLNPFDAKAVCHYTGVERVWERFRYLELAQAFTAPAKQTLLKSVTIQRLANNPADRGQQTTFRIHVYDKSLTGTGPGEELSSDAIVEKNTNSGNITIKLPEKILLPNKTFFIAIEWLRIEYNKCVCLSALYFEVRQQQIKCYSPYIGLSDTKGDSVNTWGLDFNGNWKPYTYFAPDLTDFAISAEVEY